MSAYGQAEFTREYVSDPNKNHDNGLAVLVRWIPGEVIAVYAAAVGLLGDTAGSKAAAITWVSALGFALLIALLGAEPWTLAGNKTRTWVLVASLIFTIIAFILWSFTVPGSAGYRWDYAADHPAISVLAALGGLILGALSEPILKWIKAVVQP